MKNNEVKFCECGCGREVTLGRRFISGHNRRGCKNSPEFREASRRRMLTDNPAKREDVRKKMSLAKRGKKYPLERCLKMSKSLTNNPKVIAARKRHNNRAGTETSAIARLNMSNGAKGKILSSSHRENIRKGLLNHFSVLENRIKRAEQVSDRIKLGGYQYKTGRIYLPSVGRKLLYRSSYEKLALILLDMKPEVQDILVEPIRIPYDFNGKTKIYIPDFLVKLSNGNQILIEVKPRAFVKGVVLIKAEAAKVWAKNNNAVFCIWTEDILHNSSSTTTSLQEIVRATVSYPMGRRYSLNSIA